MLSYKELGELISCTSPIYILIQLHGTCISWHTPFLPQGLFTCFFHLGHTFPREPHGLLPRLAQISPSQSSNVAFSMRLSLTPLFKITSKFSPFLFSSALFFFLALITSTIYMPYIVLIYFVYYLSLSIRL